MTLSELLKLLSNEYRLRIINLMLQRPICLCEVEIILNIPQTTCTKQAKKLLDFHFITSKKVSIWTEYSLNTNFLDDNPWIIETLKKETYSNPVFIKDLNRFQFYTEKHYENLFEDRVTSYVKQRFEEDYAYSLKA